MFAFFCDYKHPKSLSKQHCGASLPANQVITAQCIPEGDVVNPLFEPHCAMARTPRSPPSQRQIPRRSSAFPAIAMANAHAAL